MQTFLPYANFRKSLECLDPKRLGNQIYRECLNLVRGGWKNHPASKMWQGYEYALCEYSLVGLEVLKERGKDYPHHRETFLEIQRNYPDTGLPPWIGDEAFHASHRSNLLRKNIDYYSQFGWTEPTDLEYIWPSKLNRYKNE